MEFKLTIQSVLAIMGALFLCIGIGILSGFIYNKYFGNDPQVVEKPIIETEVKIKTIYVPEKTINKVDIDVKDNANANEKLESILQSIEGAE